MIALAGDGAMQMNGLAELLTIRRYWELWAGPRFVVCVFHNNDLVHVTWEPRAMGGAPKFEQSQSLPEVSYAGVARAMGLRAIAVDDPEVPPIPPHITVEQMKATAESIVKGDPSGWHMITEMTKNKATEIFTHR